MNQQYENIQQLSDFVSKQDLRNKKSVTHFYALVSITTAQNRLTNQQLEVMISFDNFDSCGYMAFMTGNFDPHLYLTSFEGKWPTTRYEHVDNEFLKISAIHTHNAAIGQCSVKISPLGRVNN